MSNRSDTRARALARALHAEGDPRAAFVRDPGRPGATPEQRLADQDLVRSALRHLDGTHAELGERCGLSRAMVGRVAAGKRALSAGSRARVKALMNAAVEVSNG